MPRHMPPPPLPDALLMPPRRQRRADAALMFRFSRYYAAFDADADTRAVAYCYVDMLREIYSSDICALRYERVLLCLMMPLPMLIDTILLPMLDAAAAIATPPCC